MRVRIALMLAVGVLCSATATQAADIWGLEKGNVELKSAGPLAFGPDGILFIGDPQAAAVVALSTGDTKGHPENVSVNLPNIDGLLAGLVGGSSQGITIGDLAVNPASGQIYLSVSGGKSGVSIVRINDAGKLSLVSLKGVPTARVDLPNPPADAVTGEGRRRRNYRLESITDLAFVDGRVLVSGRSSKDTPSNVRSLAFPFEKADDGSNIEIYHGAHGRVEGAAVVRTFVPFNINGEPTLLAGFTCTPLVKFPIPELKAGKKVRGTTVAELGNRNRPLDMIVYKKGGKDYLLLSNSARGVMKISTENIERQEGITDRVSGGGVAGQKYDTIKSLEGVAQLDKLNDTHAVVIIEADGTQALKTVELP